MTENIEQVLFQLSKSSFRNKFHLKEKDIIYISEKGIETIIKHAEDFIEKRLASDFISNDGKQTPMKGHPVFIAQHATATCCRGCLQKWHHIQKNKKLSNEEKEYIKKVIINWINIELKKEKNICQ